MYLRSKRKCQVLPVGHSDSNLNTVPMQSSGINLFSWGVEYWEKYKPVTEKNASLVKNQIFCCMTRGCHPPITRRTDTRARRAPLEALKLRHLLRQKPPATGRPRLHNITFPGISGCISNYSDFFEIWQILSKQSTSGKYNVEQRVQLPGPEAKKYGPTGLWCWLKKSSSRRCKNKGSTRGPKKRADPTRSLVPVSAEKPWSVSFRRPSASSRSVASAWVKTRNETTQKLLDHMVIMLDLFFPFRFCQIDIRPIYFGNSQNSNGKFWKKMVNQKLCVQIQLFLSHPKISHIVIAQSRGFKFSN